MCYPVCGMVYIKKTLLLIGKSSPCGGSGFSLSLSEWSFTIDATKIIIFAGDRVSDITVYKSVLCADR